MAASLRPKSLEDQRVTTLRNTPEPSFANRVSESERDFSYYRHGEKHAWDVQSAKSISGAPRGVPSRLDVVDYTLRYTGAQDGINQSSNAMHRKCAQARIILKEATGTMPSGRRHFDLQLP